MAEHLGIVVETISADEASVTVDRKDACGGCESSASGCKTCLAGAKLEGRVTNRVGAKPGDLVKVHLASDNLFIGAAILYLLPVVALLCGAFVGAWLIDMGPLEPQIAGTR